MNTFTIKTNNNFFSVSGSIQACQAFREIKQNDPEGSHVLLNGDKVLMSHNDENKSRYSNCNS
tara:strand:+ start:209 stop:397 length:189 start_codon:yes stop_codon:yes gene_type:complete